MNFDKDTRPEGVPTLVADVLAEAMPWIKNATGKTVVIKYGGNAMTNEQLRADVMADIVLLRIIGLNPVIVHGGGPAISAAMKNSGIAVEWVDGLRVTTPEVMKIVRTVLVGQVNQDLVDAMNIHGNLAVGLSGADAGTVIARQADPRLGLVGEVTDVNPQLIQDLIDADYIPVIASVARGEDGQCYNINADIMAGHVAAAIGAHKVIFLTDVDGIYVDFDDKGSLISNMTLAEAEEMMRSGTISSGMIPKLTACATALTAGVHRAHVLNGTTPHSLLLELLTDHGIGTMICRPKEEVESFEEQPLTNFAAKLNI